jgi:hypothetical protein
MTLLNYSDLVIGIHNNRHSSQVINPIIEIIFRDCENANPIVDH